MKIGYDYGLLTKILDHEGISEHELLDLGRTKTLALLKLKH